MLFIDSCSVCFLIRKESSSQLILTTRVSPWKRSSSSGSSIIPPRNALPHKIYFKTPLSRLRQEIVTWTKCSKVRSLYELYPMRKAFFILKRLFSSRHNWRYWTLHETVFTTCSPCAADGSRKREILDFETRRVTVPLARSYLNSWN